MQAPAEWLEDRPEGALLRVQVQPRAKRSEVAGVQPGSDGKGPRLKIRVAAPPVDGAANEALLSFLSDALGVAGSRLSIERGLTGRTKDLLCSGLAAESVRAKLLTPGARR